MTGEARGGKQCIYGMALAIREKVNLNKKKESIHKTLKVFKWFSGEENTISSLKYPKVDEYVISLHSSENINVLKLSSCRALKDP